jgi:hypothetical protein
MRATLCSPVRCVALQGGIGQAVTCDIYPSALPLP